jgi:hypothetical protein
MDNTELQFEMLAAFFAAPACWLFSQVESHKGANWTFPTLLQNKGV